MPARSFHVVGLPDLLHDLALDFREVGWEASVAGWHAVITAPPPDATAPAPEWPTEVTLLEVTDEDHPAAARRGLA